MADHERFQTLAEHPDLMDGADELAAFAAHLEQCPSCARTLLATQNFEGTLKQRLGPPRPCLSDNELQQLKRNGFDPALGTFTNPQEWHLLVCHPCRNSYAKVSVRRPPITWPRILGIAAGFLVLVSIPLIWFRVGQDKIPAPDRGSIKIQLRTPEEGATIAPFQPFSWEGPSPGPVYTLHIIDPATSTSLLERQTSGTNYLLLPSDATHLQRGQQYAWYVSYDSSATASTVRSSRRQFRYSEQTKEDLHGSSINREERLRIIARVRDGSQADREHLLIDLGNRLNALDSERSDDRVWLLRTIGSIFSHLERYHEAFPYLENARALWRTIGISEPAPYAALLNNCALSAQRSGRLQIAIERYNEALTVARSLDQAIHSKLLSNCLLNFGTLYHDLGMPEIAERYYKEVIDIDRRSPEVVALAQDILDYGNLLVNELGDPIQGTRYLEEALALLGKRPHNDEINAVLANLSDSLAGAYRVQGDIERAITTYQKALTIDVVRHNYRGFIQTTNNIGEMLLDKREGPAEAEACFQRSLSVITRHPDIDPDVVWRTYEGLARVAIRQGAPNEAQVAARRAADIVRSLVQPIDESQPRRLFGAGRSLPYYTLALLSARRGDAKMLVDAVESAKAVAFRESIAGSGPVASQNAVSERVEEWLGPRELALEYLFGEETDPVILLAVMHSGVFWAELQERRAIENRVRATLAKASSLGRISRESLSQLAGLLLPTKIIELLRLNVIQRIVVCPDGMLENVPFEGLAVPRGDGRSEFLINFATISVAPSLRWWAMWRTLPPRRWRRDVLVIAEPETATGQRDFGSLPGSQREADTVLSWGSHDSMRLSGSHANSDEFRSAESGEFKVLHFATHARTGGTLATSFLLFRSTPALDVLHGADILKLGLDGQLVILSACGTGEGRAVSGEGLDSLAHGFLTAGASYVIASRGPLKDDIPGPFMAALYQQLARGDTVDQALRMTKLHFLETGTSAGLESALAFEGIGFGDFTIPLTPIWTTQFFLLVRKYWIFGVGFMSLLLTVVVSLVVRKGQRSVKQAL